jgi:hypothetical protein
MKKLLFVILSIGLLAKNGWAGPNDAILDLCGYDATWNPDGQKCVFNPPLDKPVTEINGIPMQEVEAIMGRHFEQLKAISGMTGVGLGADGFDVEVQGAPDMDRRPVCDRGSAGPCPAVPTEGELSHRTLTQPVNPEQGAGDRGNCRRRRAGGGRDGGNRVGRRRRDAPDLV